MSIVQATTVRNGDGVQIYPATTWVNFNGTGTVAIRSGGNVSSITDGGVGLYTANFTNALPDVSYTHNYGFSGDVNVQVGIVFPNGILSTSLQVFSYNPANSANSVDKTYLTITIHR